MSEYILNSRYLNENEKTFEDICKRVIPAIIDDNEEIKERLLKDFINKRFAPGGRVIAYAGTNSPLAPNCVVLPMENGVPNLLKTLRRSIKLQKEGCGIGFNYSEICFDYLPDVIEKPATVSPFVVYLDFNHPDIFNFITVKFKNLKKAILIKEPLDNSPRKIREINYDQKFKLGFPVILREHNFTTSDLIEFAKLYGVEIINDTGNPEAIPWPSDEKELLTELGEKITARKRSDVITLSDTLDNVINVLEYVGSYTDSASNCENLADFMRGFAVDFSNLREAYAPCVSAKTNAAGPIAFMRIFDIVINAIINKHRTNALSWLFVFSSCSDIITQHGRNGANIGIINSENKNLIDFMDIKQNLSVINNYNLSILFSREFMEDLERNPGKIGIFEKCKYDAEFLIIERHEIPQTVSEIWAHFIQNSYNSGEPGAIFRENVNKNNPLRKIFGDIITTNPCSEITLYPNECCNLSSINLEKFAKQRAPADYFPQTLAEVVELFDVEEFKRIARDLIYFLNCVIDKLTVGDAELLKAIKLFRRCGLGFMGFANLLLSLNVPYCSKLARKFAKFLAKTLYDECDKESRRLSYKYPTLKQRLTEAGYIVENYGERLDDSASDSENDEKEKINNILSRVNVALCCCAPTGSTSMLLDASYSIEPHFRMCYKKVYNAAEKADDIFVNKYMREYLEENGLYNIKNLIEISNNGITGAQLYDKNGKPFKVPKQIKELFKNANEITPVEHISMQAAFQKYIDNSISKTVNAPESISVNDVDGMFRIAYFTGCKGCTIYRDNCRKGVLMSVSSEDIAADKTENDNAVDVCPLFCTSEKCDG